MAIKKIIFRADGNSKNGLGHLYRIFALIEIYSAEFDCTLLTRSDSCLEVIPTKYKKVIIPSHFSLPEEIEWIYKNYPPEKHFIIADGYHFDATYQSQLKKLSYHVTYIDDMAAEHMFADIVVNHSLAVKPENYDAENYTTFALGTRFAMLRPRFLKAASKERVVNAIDSVFVCFGGADPFNLSLKAVLACLNLTEIVEIHLVLGAAYSHTKIFELLSMHSKLRIYRDISEEELLSVMFKCNLAIASASTILYELCAVKMPVLSGYYVANQKNLYFGAVKFHLVFEGGDFEQYSVEDFSDKIKTVLTLENLQVYMAAQAKLFDFGIKNRFLRLLRPVTYRKANSEDLLLIYDWANDNLSRNNSYFSETISLENHKVWYEKKLIDPQAIMYIAEVDTRPIGMIRYDMTENKTVVGIVIDEEFRGKGLATELLTGSAHLYFNGNPLPIFAYIKKTNRPSIRSFENVGYKKVSEEIIHHAESFVYRLERSFLVNP